MISSTHFAGHAPYWHSNQSNSDNFSTTSLSQPKEPSKARIHTLQIQRFPTVDMVARNFSRSAGVKAKQSNPLLDYLEQSAELSTAAMKGDTAAAQRLLEDVDDVTDVNVWIVAYCAVQSGNKDMLRMAIDKGVKVNTTDVNGNTFAHIAMEKGNVDVLLYLLEKGADLNLSNFTEGETVLHVAARNPEILAMLGAARHDPKSLWFQLSKKGANWSASDFSGNTAAKNIFFSAAKMGNIELLDQIVEKKLVNINARDSKTNATILHAAAFEGRTNVLEWAIGNGVDIEAQDREGNTYLQHVEPNADVLEWARARGIDAPAEAKARKGGVGSTVLSNPNCYDIRIGSESSSERADRNFPHDFSDDTEAHEAARAGDIEKLDMLKSIPGFDINEHSPSDDATIAQRAASAGKMEVLEWVRENGGDLNAEDKSGRTIMHYAASASRIDVLQWGINNGMDINAKSYTTGTVLLEAARFGDSLTQKFALENNADVEAIDDTGRTALNIAAERGDFALLNALLHLKADLKNQDNRGRTALHTAALRGDVAMVELLASAPRAINIQDNDGRTALHLAAQCGDTAMIELLLENGADITIPDKRGLQPMFTAAESGHVNALKKILDFASAKSILLDGGTEININTSNSSGFTVMHFAALRNNFNILEFAIENGADIEAKNHLGSTAAHVAAAAGQIDALRILIDKGARIDARDNRWNTLAHMAATAGHIAVLQTLIDKGVDINAKNRAGATPLHNAAYSGDLAVLKLLLKNGASLELKDGCGRNLLQVAVLNPHNNKKMLAYLTGDLGIPINSQEKDHKTALHNIVKSQNIEILQWAVDQGADIHAQDSFGNTPIHYAVWAVARSSSMTKDKSIATLKFLHDLMQQRVENSEDTRTLEGDYGNAFSFEGADIVRTTLIKEGLTLPPLQLLNDREIPSDFREMMESKQIENLPGAPISVVSGDESEINSEMMASIAGFGKTFHSERTVGTSLTTLDKISQLKQITINEEMRKISDDTEAIKLFQTMLNVFYSMETKAQVGTTPVPGMGQLKIDAFSLTVSSLSASTATTAAVLNIFELVSQASLPIISTAFSLVNFGARQFIEMKATHDYYSLNNQLASFLDKTVGHVKDDRDAFFHTAARKLTLILKDGKLDNDVLSSSIEKSLEILGESGIESVSELQKRSFKDHFRSRDAVKSDIENKGNRIAQLKSKFIHLWKKVEGTAEANAKETDKQIAAYTYASTFMFIMSLAKGELQDQLENAPSLEGKMHIALQAFCEHFNQIGKSSTKQLKYDDVEYPIVGVPGNSTEKKMMSQTVERLRHLEMENRKHQQENEMLRKELDAIKAREEENAAKLKALEEMMKKMMTAQEGSSR